jgi:hypothetical protein
MENGGMRWRCGALGKGKMKDERRKDEGKMKDERRNHIGDIKEL